MTQKKHGRELAWMLCSTAAAATLALAGCGGGGGGTAGASTASPSAASAGSADSSTAGGSTPSTATAGPVGVDAVASAAQAAGIAEVDGQPNAQGNAQANVQAVVPTPTSTAASAGPAPMLGDCEMFPSNAIFNTRIDDTSKFPSDPSSSAWVNMVGAGTSMLPNWGTTSNASDLGGYFGIPVNVVDGTAATTQWPTVSFDFAASGQSSDEGYPDKSDCASGTDGSIVQGCSQLGSGQRRFPFPAQNLVAEGGTCAGPGSCGDHHVAVIEKGACRLWEAFYAFPINGQWYAASTAAWNLRSLALRPDGWASADAAGLPITPLLAKASEASTGEIRHALRVTFRDAALALQHRWPARFAAGGDNPGAIPFGALLRLRSDFVIPDNWTAQAKAVATAAKRYGMYVADNGMDFYVQGEPDSAWDPATSSQLRAITMGNMEFVDLKAVTGDPRFSNDSMAASW